MEKEFLEAILNSYKRILRDVSEIKQILKTKEYDSETAVTNRPKNLMLEYRNMKN